MLNNVINMKSIEHILDQFDLQRDKFNTIGERTHGLIEELLRQRRVKIHTISYRIKEKESLRTKINEKVKYTTLTDITDIVGIRIITLFEDDVNEVAKMLKEEFEVDPENSVDKRVTQYDKFGYSSLHFIVSFKASRVQLSEYRIFEGQKVEIQIRSILQHAWAEMEHDIGYKSHESIPDVAKRNFARLSALLETADFEFIRLRDTLLLYGREVKDNILVHPELIELDGISLLAFDEANDLLKKLDMRITELFEANLIEDNKYLAEWGPRLNFMGIKNIGQLSNLIISEEDNIIELTRNFIQLSNAESLKIKNLNFPNTTIRGISLHYLCYLLIAEKADLNFSLNYLKTFITAFETEKLLKQIVLSHNVINKGQ